MNDRNEESYVLSIKIQFKKRKEVKNIFLVTHDRIVYTRRRIGRPGHPRGARHARGGGWHRQPGADHHLRRQDPDGSQAQRVPTQSRGHPQHVPARPEGRPRSVPERIRKLRKGRGLETKRDG